MPTTTHSQRLITDRSAEARSAPENTQEVSGQATIVASTPATIRPLYSAFMILPPGEVLTNIAPIDRRDDREAAEHQRVERGLRGGAAEHQRAQQHRRDQRDRVGLEQVGGHAGAVADVVTDVVGDHRRVARVVLGDACLDLADQVGADVGALGEDAAAQTREDRDQRRSERQADQRLEGRVQLDPLAVRRGAQQDGVVAGHAEQAEAHHQHAGDRAALEGDVQRLGQPLRRRLRGAHVGAHRHVHADVAGGAREDRADGESDGGLLAQAGHEQDDQEQDHADDADRPVLPVQVRLGAGLDRCGDLLHPGVAGGKRQDRTARHDAVEHRENAADQREQQARVRGC